MSESLTLTLSGRSSILKSNYFPPIELPRDRQYYIGLVEIFTYNSIPNISRGQNRLYYTKNSSEQQFIEIPTGSYEIVDINKYLTAQLNTKDVTFDLKVNKNTLRCKISSSASIHFTKPDSIGSILGFERKILKSSVNHTGDFPVNIINHNVFRISCNIATGSYINGEKSHIIHEFYPKVAPGYKLSEIPTPIIYLPINTSLIDFIELKIIDQNNQLIDFRQEEIIIRLHIKAL